MTEQREPHAVSEHGRSSLRRKFVQTILIVSGSIGAITLAVVLLLSTHASKRNLHEIEVSIEEGIASKGKVLTENHALALRGMVLDNAFLDMQTLVARAVGQDPDLVYGIFVNPAGEALAFARHDAPAEATSVPSKEAGKALGLTQSELMVHEESVRRLQRLGQEVVEVAVPVVGEDGEALGTVRYGLSTRRMYRAIMAAAAESKTQQVRSLLLIGAAVGLTTILGVVLGRLQAVRMTRPVQALTRAASDLAAGDRSVRVTIESNDELQLLGLSFNRMVAELSSSYDELQNLNRTLEQKVELRTLELASRNRDMRLVLDNVDQGFITLSLDGTMASERSAVVERWFGQCTTAHTFWRYLSDISPEFSFGFELGWDQLVSDALPCELAIAQLPTRLTHSGSTYDFRYLPFMRGEQLEGVLVVVQNVTLELQRQRKEAEFAELMQALRCTLLDRSGCAAFFKEASLAVATICNTDAPLPVPALKNILHTFKGNAGQLGLTVVAGLCHGLEDELTKANRLNVGSLERLSSHWQTLLAGIERFIGPVDRDSLEISKSDYAALISALSRAANTAVLHQALSWQLEPVARPLRRLANQAQALTERLGKAALEVRVEASPLRLDMDAFGPFFSDLGHLVRNAVDHGIETGAQRRAAGKPANGRLTLRVQAKDRSLIFELSDDGAGIDWDSVRDMGHELGLPSGTPEELLELLCHQGVTTRSEVSETSGRGVGMSAIKQRIQAMHGTLAVESTRGSGTTWRIVLPWAPEQALEQLRQQWQTSGPSTSKAPLPGSA